jgi:hypothetical protein
MKTSLISLSLLFASSILFSQNLTTHLWEDRVILVFGSSSAEKSAQTQFTKLSAEPSDLADRNLVIYQIYDQEGQTPEGKSLTAKELKVFRQKFNIEVGTFAVLLIGKDGGVKMKKTDLVEPQLIFDLIDSMPMRQAEMRRKG